MFCEKYFVQSKAWDSLGDFIELFYDIWLNSKYKYFFFLLNNMHKKTMNVH